MPDRQLRGGPWELVPDDRLGNQPYFRQPLPDPNRTPQAFAVLVGDRWVASMPTKEWMAIALRKRVREDVPTVLRPLVPYRLVSGLLLRSSEVYICGLLHESFHAYQGALNPERFAAAETAVGSCESRYPWARPASLKGWQTELDLLMKALRSSTKSQTAGWARQFLAQRSARRGADSLDVGFLQYERAREWLEGLAKYAELEVWRQAISSPTYRPLPSISEDPEFGRYKGFDGRWSQEVAQIGRSTGARDGLFYYSGMAQAVLLDRLLPLWKARAMADGLWLEDLLREALKD
jgi:hypothetical protein